MHALIAVMFKSCCCYVLSQHPCHVQCDVTQSYWTLRLLVLLHISLCVKLTRASALDQCITPMHSVYATHQAYRYIHEITSKVTASAYNYFGLCWTCTTLGTMSYHQTSFFSSGIQLYKCHGNLCMSYQHRPTLGLTFYVMNMMVQLQPTSMPYNSLLTVFVVANTSVRHRSALHAMAE
eukprot:2205-Heterococcus_DN1.PRE.1